MGNLNVSNDIITATTVSAAPHQQNYSEIVAFVNAEVVHRDGTVAMTNQLLLPGDATTPNAACTKAQMETEVSDHASLSTHATPAILASDHVTTAPVPSTTATSLGLQVSVSPPKGGIVMVVVAVDATCTTPGSTLIVTMRKDGTAVGPQLLWNPPTAGERQTLTKTWVVSADPIPATYDAFIAKSAAAGVYAVATQHTTLDAVFVG